MLARISTHLACTQGELWDQISRPQSLQFVVSPLLKFRAVEPGTLDGEWEVGRDYQLQLYLLGHFPLGRHTIYLTRVDREQNTIASRERGLLARVWNHTIFFREITPGLVNYTDEIEIQAGWLTPFIWAFAHLFYHHRQRRRKVLLKQNQRRQP